MIDPIPTDTTTIDHILERGRTVTSLAEVHDTDLADCVRSLCDSLDLTLGGDVYLVKGGDTEPHLLVPQNGHVPYAKNTLVCVLGEMQACPRGYYGSLRGYHFIFLTEKPVHS